ncbi:LysM domain-containing protein [Paenisporosarcina cavernae]|uniref:LysM domain-containing protein n=2 Tax=Paenisporosarcina cavernae TaxID=2320858 RepID=A0A385YWT1_9BACL|nr:LysM domain-containing protein [Paenisporosarcina cavernae]
MNVSSYTIQPGDTYWELAQRYNLSVHDIVAVNPRVNPCALYVGQMIYLPISLSSSKCLCAAEVELKENMRSLWEEHVAWTRMTIISMVFNLPDVDMVTARLLQNATDMGNLLRPLYGDQIADMYSALIREHLEIAGDLVKAALEGNEQEATTAETNWYLNADQVASFLHHINPFISESEFRTMFYRHLQLTKMEAVLMMNKDYQKGIAEYDTIQEQALGMSDTITAAIVKQFPLIFSQC